MEDSSPYEPVAPNRHPDAFRLASISSGIAGFALHWKRGGLSHEGKCDANIPLRLNEGSFGIKIKTRHFD